MGQDDARWDYSKVMKLDFEYATPDNDAVTIEMRDDTPTATVKVTHRKTSIADYYTHTLSLEREYSAGLPLVKLNPREAGQATWQAALNHAPGIKLSPFMILNLRGRPTWDILYSDANAGLFDVDDINLSVDAQTGAILKEDYTGIQRRLQLTPTTNKP